MIIEETLRRTASHTEHWIYGMVWTERGVCVCVCVCVFSAVEPEGRKKNEGINDGKKE